MKNNWPFLLKRMYKFGNILWHFFVYDDKNNKNQEGMKLKINFIAILSVCLWGMSSCSSSNDDKISDGTSIPEQVVETAFLAKYPGAMDAKWEAKGNFREVDFKLAGVDYEAWFSKSGTWLQAEHAIVYESLPSAVKLSIDNSINYPPTSWMPDNQVEMTEMLDYPDWYAVELKNGNQEVTLWIDGGGNEVKEVVEDYSGSDIPARIGSFILQKYPQAVIVEAVKLTNETFEAVTLDAEKVKIVFFDRAYNWNHTAWFVTRTEVPEAVLDVLSGEAYSGYTIEQIQYWQNPDREYYHFLLVKNGGSDLTVNVSATGDIVFN